MKIAEYLKYYIGAQFRVHYIDNSLEEWTVWVTLTPLRLAKLDDASIDNIQLQLRKLEDMTDEECIKWAELGFYEPHTVKRASIPYNSLEVEFDFYMGDDLHSGTMSLRSQTAQQFHYLLSKGFDLFGLIPAGLAIDAKTINTPNND